MFFVSIAFNQDISSWDVSNVENMEAMFSTAIAFNQDIGSWRINRVTTLANFLSSVTLSTTNYDSILIGWNSRKNGVIEEGLPAYSTDINVNFGGSQYTNGGAASTARSELVTYGWTISDGGPV